ncbi:hypothetical protein LJR230_002324 [Trinickia sp. LjRoot230]|uniref:hypothetical protein n=1 Tax=Trinickia sp. LjRoot230 TaxID=3342288 RepID=UPI003ECC65B0
MIGKRSSCRSAALAMARSTTNTVGLAISLIKNGYFADAINAIEEECASIGMMVTTAVERAEGFRDSLRERGLPVARSSLPSPRWRSRIIRLAKPPRRSSRAASSLQAKHRGLSDSIRASSSVIRAAASDANSLS